MPLFDSSSGKRHEMWGREQGNDMQQMGLGPGGSLLRTFAPMWCATYSAMGLPPCLHFLTEHFASLKFFKTIFFT